MAGAAILGDPMPLARALERLDAANRDVPLGVSPSVTCQFTVQPLSGVGLGSIFSTHPPTSERVARLRAPALEPTDLAHNGR